MRLLGLGLTLLFCLAHANIGNIIPMPVRVTQGAGNFTLSASTSIVVFPGSPEMRAIGQFLVNIINPSTGFGLSVSVSDTPGTDSIFLTATLNDATLGKEGYDLQVMADSVRLAANDVEGIFRGVQTIRQLFPAKIELRTRQTGPFELGVGTVYDYPRFPFRGAMLDVARHFFTIPELKRFVDTLAYYKGNSFHVHLSDDQGWRIVINDWANLTNFGSRTQVWIRNRQTAGNCTMATDGGPCYYTQAQYTDLVNYAKARYIDIIPEIDMPGHINAALASYAKLNCNNVAPAPRTDTAVGYSSLCVPSAGIPQATMDFMHAIVDQLTALSPGPFMHVGGDESAATPLNDYKNFVTQVQARVQANGKRMYGWEENSKIDAYSSSSVAQHWNKGSGNAPDAVKKGAKVVMSPCEHAYFDMTYGRDTPPGLGLNWCGTTNVQQSYEWNPGTMIVGVTEKDVLGVEGCLWGETILTTTDIDLLMWPRLCSLQEVGWSAVTGRSWAEYRLRLASHGPRLTNMGVHFFKSAEVPWLAATE